MQEANTMGGFSGQYQLKYMISGLITTILDGWFIPTLATETKKVNKETPSLDPFPNSYDKLKLQVRKQHFFDTIEAGSCEVIYTLIEEMA